MIVTAHQPHFFPWIGYLNRIHLCDCFMIMDNMLFTNNNYISRNRIINSKGIQYINLPVRKVNGLKTRINELLIDNKTKNNWKLKLLRTIKHNYYQGEGFKYFFPLLEDLFSANYELYIDFYLKSLDLIMKYIGIEKKIMLASEKNTLGRKENELFLNILRDSNCNHILLGIGASTKYIDKNFIENKGFKVCYQKFEHPIYKQKSREFIKGLSILDMLLNIDRETATNIVKLSGKIIY